MQPVRLPQSLVTKLKLTSDVALLVVSLESGGPADQGGLLLGDVLLEIDGAALSDPGDLLAHLGPDRIGQSVATRVIRGGQAKTISVTVGERPRSRAA
jgi:serine protease Do